MKKIHKLFVLIGALSVVCGCGGPVKEVSIRNVEVYGSISFGTEWLDRTEDSEDYFAVDGGVFKFMIKGKKIMVDIPVKTIKAIDFSLDKVDEVCLSVANGGLYMNDSKGDRINLMLEDSDVVNKLLKSSVGDRTILEFSYPLLDENPDIVNQIDDFDITIDLYAKNADGKSSSKASVSRESEDWDDILDDYESYVDNYISYLKKATNGDTKAMEAVAEMLEDAQELSEKLDNAEDDLSSSQMSRYLKITSKLSSAAAEMAF